MGICCEILYKQHMMCCPRVGNWELQCDEHWSTCWMRVRKKSYKPKMGVAPAPEILEILEGEASTHRPRSTRPIGRSGHKAVSVNFGMPYSCVHQRLRGWGCQTQFLVNDDQSIWVSSNSSPCFDWLGQQQSKHPPPKVLEMSHISKNFGEVECLESEPPIY